MKFREQDKKEFERLFSLHDHEEIKESLVHILESYPEYVDSREIFTVDDADVILDNLMDYLNEMDYIDLFRLRARIRADYIEYWESEDSI